MANTLQKKGDLLDYMSILRDEYDNYCVQKAYERQRANIFDESSLIIYWYNQQSQTKSRRDCGAQRNT